MSEHNKNINRRQFFGNAAAAGAIGALGLGYLASCSDSSKGITSESPEFLDKAPDGQPLKAGLVGCGGRGTGAALNFINAGSGLSVVTLADMFEDRMSGCRQKLKEQAGVEIPDEKCYLGFDGYKKVLEEDIDVVILATPPYFRPEHFKAAIEARKHVFMEKPVAVDPVGARAIIASARKAETIGLTVVTGTQRRHMRNYVDIATKVKAGAIGDIVSANVYWNQSKLWHKDPRPEWTEMEYMIRDWVNWSWLSGDHIVEQHVHNIDVANWFMDKFPVKAVGFGSRHRRVTGDQYDNFSVDFTYEGDIHVHSMCRQINDCTNNVSELIRGTEGYTNAYGIIWNPDGTEKYKYPFPADDNGEPGSRPKVSPYDQEHIDMVAAIRTNNPINEAEATAKSTLAAIMGRISAYTGLEQTWEEMMASEITLGPEELKMGKVDVSKNVPIPGSAPA